MYSYNCANANAELFSYMLIVDNLFNILCRLLALFLYLLKHKKWGQHVKLCTLVSDNEMDTKVQVKDLAKFNGVLRSINITDWTKEREERHIEILAKRKIFNT